MSNLRKIEEAVALLVEQRSYLEPNGKAFDLNEEAVKKLQSLFLPPLGRPAAS
jgi:hypothetical protein